MSELLHELVHNTAERVPDNQALERAGQVMDYAALSSALHAVAGGFAQCGLQRGERIAVYLPKQLEAVLAMLGATQAGGVFVPVNPVLKPAQVGHILRDCNVRVLVSSRTRLTELKSELAACHDLRTVIVTDGVEPLPGLPGLSQIPWGALADAEPGRGYRVIDVDIAAILYTSGSTGRPKGVVLSHRNMVTGAHSVAGYLENSPRDRILTVLPFSFDYGFSQLSTAFSVGACAVLMEYLLPRDVLRAAERHAITGLAAVPPLWVQLAPLEWPGAVRDTLRYITNSGGAMPRRTLGQLRAALPATRVFLMYGLTEAFRSSYLPPEEIDRRPDSMGKAIPNAEILVVREDGSPCAPGEPGELVHRGSLVAMGYWNDEERTNERFRPAPGREAGLTVPELAVWSGDTVRTDEQGFLYFVGRRDDMIKSSGYRVSPTEIEEIVYATDMVAEAAAFGVPHPQLGQAIVLAAVPKSGSAAGDEALLAELRSRLPAFMVPVHVAWQEALPRNPNGKIDRKRLTGALAGLFEDEAT